MATEFSLNLVTVKFPTYGSTVECSLAAMFRFAILILKFAVAMNLICSTLEYELLFRWHWLFHSLFHLATESPFLENNKKTKS